MQGQTKPAWRQREADCRKIGSALQVLCKVEEAEVLKQYFEVADIDHSIEIEEYAWERYNLYWDFNNAEITGDKYDYARTEIAHNEKLSELRYAKKRKMLEIEEFYPDLFDDANNALLNIESRIKHYRHVLPISDVTNGTEDKIDPRRYVLPVSDAETSSNDELWANS